MSEVFVFIKQTFPFPRLVNSAIEGLKEGKKLSGEALFPGFRLALPKSCEKSRQLVKTNRPFSAFFPVPPLENAFTVFS
jgi:hypothetical protein